MSEHPNPWTRLPEAAPYVLAEDAPAIREHNARVGSDHQIRLEVVPEPYTGPADAPVVLLNLNPGFGEADIPNYSQPERREMMRASLTHDLTPETSFYHLAPEFAGTGADLWWTKKLNPLIRRVGRDAVRAGIQVIEHFPYKSHRYKPLADRLRSQEYSFHLARQAIHRDALIVVMRASKQWTQAVPELLSANLHQLKNPQNVTIGPGNCPSGFGQIVKLLS